MKIEIKVPASSANVGSGIDCFGIALPLWLRVKVSGAHSLETVFNEGFERDIPLESNLFVRAARRIFEKFGEPLPDMRIEMETDVPEARGLASSASALVAGALCANEWLGAPLTTDELITEASALEGHPDNVAPCMLGGFTVAATIDGKVMYKKLDPRGLRVAVAVPDYALSTEKARAVLPQTVTLSDAIAQLQRACLLVAAVACDDRSLLAAASEDLIFTPARRPLIRGFDEVTAAARNAGAYCSMISGAGPTIMALCGDACADAVAEAMGGAFDRAGITSRSLALRVDDEGASCVRTEG